MRVTSPDPTPRESGDYRVDDTPGYGKPHADIWLDEKGDLRLRWVEEGDCERLIRAAAETLERLRRHKAMAAAPHGRGRVYQGTCQLCGKPEGDELHAEAVPEPPAAPAAHMCECGHFEAYHVGAALSDPSPGQCTSCDACDTYEAAPMAAGQ